MEKMNNQKKTSALKALYEHVSSGENDNAFLDSPYCEVIVSGYERDFVLYMKELGLSESEVCAMWLKFMLKSIDWVSASYGLAPHDVLEHPLRPYTNHMAKQYLIDTACALIHVLQNDPAAAAVIENRLRYAAEYGFPDAKVLYMIASCVREEVFIADYVMDVLNEIYGMDLLEYLMDQMYVTHHEKTMFAYPALSEETKTEWLWHMLSRNGVCARRMAELKKTCGLTDAQVLEVMNYEIAVFTSRFMNRSFKGMMEQLQKDQDRDMTPSGVKSQIREYHINKLLENGGYEDDGKLPF